MLAALASVPEGPTSPVQLAVFSSAAGLVDDAFRHLERRFGDAIRRLCPSRLHLNGMRCEWTLDFPLFLPGLDYRSVDPTLSAANLYQPSLRHSRRPPGTFQSTRMSV